MVSVRVRLRVMFWVRVVIGRDRLRLGFRVRFMVTVMVWSNVEVCIYV